MKQSWINARTSYIPTCWKSSFLQLNTRIKFLYPGKLRQHFGMNNRLKDSEFFALSNQYRRVLPRNAWRVRGRTRPKNIEVEQKTFWLTLHPNSWLKSCWIPQHPLHTINLTGKLRFLCNIMLPYNPYCPIVRIPVHARHVMISPTLVLS